MAVKKKKQPRFEEGMEELTGLVASLEGGQLTLEQSFEAYERGIVLLQQLSQILEEGDRRIAVLRQSAELLEEAPLSLEGEERP